MADVYAGRSRGVPAIAPAPRSPAHNPHRACPPVRPLASPCVRYQLARSLTPPARFSGAKLPWIHARAGDPHDHLVQVPPITRTWPPLPQTSRKERTEFQHPAPDRFVGQVEPAFG